MLCLAAYRFNDAMGAAVVHFETRLLADLPQEGLEVCGSIDRNGHHQVPLKRRFTEVHRLWSYKIIRWITFGYGLAGYLWRKLQPWARRCNGHLAHTKNAQLHTKLNLRRPCSWPPRSPTSPTGSSSPCSLSTSYSSPPSQSRPWLLLLLRLARGLVYVRKLLRWRGETVCAPTRPM